MSAVDNRRKRFDIYFDCIFGGSISTIAIIVIVVFSTQNVIEDPAVFYAGLGFWIFILIGSLLLIYEGIHTYFLQKKHPHGIPSKKPLKAPIV
ncbi:MAG: hypothetical protein ACTSV5_06000 [Promethearchaeota archaeon]